jgi:chaperonin GroEL (HSP60 family)
VICDMVDNGIVDSFNVIKAILQDSVTLTGLLITTECLVVKEKGYTRKK